MDQAELRRYFPGLIPGSEEFSWRLIPFILIWVLFVIALLTLLFITYVVPEPRQATKAEKNYFTLDKDGKVTKPEELPCWLDTSLEKRKQAAKQGKHLNIEREIEPEEVFMTVVVPAYNEEKRLVGMLEEATEFLEHHYGSLAKKRSDAFAAATALQSEQAGLRDRKAGAKETPTPHSGKGWEILLVDDGSTDKTVETALHFGRTHLLPLLPRRNSGPWTHADNKTAVNIPPDSIRIMSLNPNRGKGGAVTHGMRHARGKYIVFADADGASDIQDLAKLVSSCQKIEDSESRGVAVGSRAHLVGSDAVVKRSKLRNFLMHSFHLILKFMTPPKTASIKDTQCGFKLFSRSTLPYIIPYMHTEGWIFDVEMLMLAEFADIPVVEVPIGWREVMGSKLNVITDSIGMAWGLAMLRFCWGVGIYRRDS